MKLQRPDGFPLTFNLSDAAEISGASISTLRNNIARDVYNHIGEVPLAGQERRFAATGLLEVALISALTDSVPLKKASQFADEFLRREYSSALFDGRVSGLCDGAITLPDAVTVTNRELCPDTFIFDANPHQWMKGPRWEDRNFRTPHLVLILFSEDMGCEQIRFVVLRGWNEVPDAVDKMAQDAVPRMLSSLPRGAKPEPLKPMPLSYTHARYPHFHILNLTAVMERLDPILERAQSAQQN